MTPQPHCDHECVCPAVSGVMRSRKDVCEVYGCPNDTRSRPAPSPERIGSIRINIFMDEQKEWLIERVNAGMGEWEYVISYLGEYFATAPSESIAREIQEAYSDRSSIAAKAREKVLDEVKQYADTCIWVGDDCCPGKMNDQEESDCDGCSYVDYPNNADICEKIISLRRHRRRG